MAEIKSDFGEPDLIPSIGPGGRAMAGQLGARRTAAKPGTPAPGVPTTELAALKDVIAELRAQRTIQQLMVLTQSNPPITDMATPLSCALLATAKWVPFHKNELNRRIRIELFCDWGLAGAGVKLSRRSGGVDEDVIDIMTESGTFGKSESKPVILKPGQTLYVRKWRDNDPAVTAAMTSASILRGRIFDVQSILSE